MAKYGKKILVISMVSSIFVMSFLNFSGYSLKDLSRHQVTAFTELPDL
jgi:hypothetical protein